MIESFVYNGKHQIETIEFILNKKEYKKTGKKVYQAYDANFYPLPNISEWNKEYADKILHFCKNRLKKEDGEIYIDDIKLKI